MYSNHLSSSRSLTPSSRGRNCAVTRGPRGPAGTCCRAAGGGRYPGPFEDIGTDMLKAPKLILSNAERVRLDESPDANFYATPRMMQHADEALLDTLSSVYSIVIPPGSCVLELCASRYSHLPGGDDDGGGGGGLQVSLLVGQGMNHQELAANPQLHQYFVQDLNLQPLLLEQLDRSYDAVLCANGIQYLTQPETVIAEASRVLRAGGVLVVAFGPDCFKEKAVAGWLSRSMQERSQLVQQIISSNGFDAALVVDSPAAAAALAAQTEQQQPTDTAAEAVAGVPQGPQAGSDLYVLVARKAKNWTAGAAEADIAAAVDMRPDNVGSWFTKPGLAGLAEAAAAPTSQGQPAQGGNTTISQPPSSNTKGAGTASSAPPPPPNPGSTSGSGGTDAAGAGVTGAAAGPAPAGGSPVNDRLLEQWHAAYESLIVDAVDLGIPRSVIPSVPRDASPAELQDAVQHLQAMMASFLSAGL